MLVVIVVLKGCGTTSRLVLIVVVVVLNCGGMTFWSSPLEWRLRAGEMRFFCGKEITK